MAKIRNFNSTKYGITERKKAEIDALSNQVLDAQHDVEQKQSIVNSLTAKLSKFEGYLATATAERDTALDNKDTMKDVVQAIKDLKNNANIAFDEMVIADSSTKTVTSDLSTLIDQLIFTSEMVNKLSTLIARKKAQNPLISNELMTFVDGIGAKADKAVADTLVALESAYTTLTTSLEAEGTSAMEYTQANNLYKTITGTDNDGKPTLTQSRSLKSLLDQAYLTALENFQKMKIANNIVIKQLQKAQDALDKAQVNLKSLQSGLAAANAAALAS